MSIPNPNLRFPDVMIPRGAPIPPLMSAEEFRARRVEWCMFFASIASLQEHPGMNRENAQPKTIIECAKIADRMLVELTIRERNGL